jgi:hypothetical protein
MSEFRGVTTPVTILQFDPTPPPVAQAAFGASNGAMWYDSTTNGFRGIVGGVISSIGGGGGSFSTLAGGTNTGNAFVLGNGSSISTTGTGTIGAAGSTGQLQYNNGGVLAGAAPLVFSSAGGATYPLTITGLGAVALALAPSAVGGAGAIFTVLDAPAGNTIFSIKGTAGAYQAQIGGAFNTHITQGTANQDFAGKLTCASSTVTKTFASAYTSTPVVLVFDETTKGGANLTAISNSGFTVSCTGTTDALDYIVIGNPT